MSDESKDKLNRINDEVAKPSTWFRAVQKGENVSSSYIWHLDKEVVYETYGNRVFVWYDNMGQKEVHAPDWKPECSHVTLSHEELVLPDGKVVTPIRQWCEVKLLASGEREAMFYNFANTQFGYMPEGTEFGKPSTPTITTKSANTNPSGSLLTVGYSSSEESPVDIIASANRAFALESINDEGKQCFNAFDSTKPTNWINGLGEKITEDCNETTKLTIEGVRTAVMRIVEEGLNPYNLVLATTGKSMIDLLADAKGLGIYDFHRLELLLGVKIIRMPVTTIGKKNIPTPESLWTKLKRWYHRKPRGTVIKEGTATRSVLFIPNVSFAIVSGKDLTMEAQRRNELQAIHLTATQRIACVIKYAGAIVRISSR